jgi:Xaa-Pro aminopeptidase
MKSQNSSQKRYKTRLLALRNRLTEWNVDGCIVENPIDLFYLLGLSLSLGSLILSKKGEILFVDGRYLQVAKEEAPVHTELAQESFIKDFLKREGIERLAFDGEKSSFERYSKLKSYCPLIPVSQLLKQLRLIKDEEERESMRRSALLLDKGFNHIKSCLREGIRERDLALEFELFCRQKGGEELAFEPIIAFGEKSSLPHYHGGEGVLKEGDSVLIDIGTVVERYHSDMTRVLFYGPPDPHLEKMYSIVKEAQAAAIALCRPGTRIGDLDRAARAVMSREGVEEFFIHGLGHGIGLETHEFPRVKSGGEDSDFRLEPFMVITIEPGLYFPGKGGVRYEDMVLITDRDHEILTLSKE